MIQNLRNQKEKGFTLIELMIVIAIIGILAAIAIPNFISYRNKAYCGEIENDASSVVAALSSYFSLARRTGRPTVTELQNLEGLSLNNTDPVANVTIAGDPNTTMTILIQKPTGNPCSKGTTFQTTIGGDGTGGWL